MTKETHFEHPPRGFVGILAYDPGENRYRILQVASDSNPNLLVQIQKDGLAPQVGNVAGDDVGTGTNVLFCAGLVYGFDGTAWDRLRCTDQKLDVALHGWDGSQERKLGLVWGYSDTVSESMIDTNIAAGTVELAGTAVPDGEVWVVTAVHVRYVGATATQLQAAADVGGNRTYVFSVVPPVTALFYPTVCSVVLAEGDYCLARVVTATAGDDLYLGYCGYKMLVTE